MTHKLWVVSELYYPEETSTGYLLTKIAEGLAQYFSVYVLCSQPTYSARGLRAPSHELHNGVHIRRCPGTTLNKDNFLFRLVNLITISISIFATAVINLRKGDIVIVVTNPPILPFAVVGASWIRRAKCLLCVHDVYPEALVATGILRSETTLTRLISYLTARLYHRMERIIVLGRDMRQLVARKVRGIDSRITLIPNWADLNDVLPGKRASNILLKELGLQDKFVIQYAGNMGRTHGIENLLEAARQLKCKEEIHFLFIGSGAKKSWIEETVRKEGLNNVTVLPNRPRSDSMNFLNACDVAVISFTSGMAGVSVPSRMYNVMAAGKPIVAVADNHSELALIVDEEHIGWIVPPDRPSLLAEAISDAYANPKRIMEMSKRARDSGAAKYSLQQVIEAYRTLLHSVEAKEVQSIR